MDEGVQAVSAEIAETSPVGRRGVEHPVRAPRRVPVGRGPVHPLVEMAHPAVDALVGQPLGVLEEGRVAHAERDRRETSRRLRLLDDPP